MTDLDQNQSEIQDSSEAHEPTDTQNHTDTAYHLKAEQLCLKTDSDILPESTKGIEKLTDFVGQERAKSAIQTALNINTNGYNVFASGTSGLGKRTMIMRLLEQHAKTCPTPDDWVYVNRFSDSRKPIAINFEAGHAKNFKEQMYKSWHETLTELKKRFKTETYLMKVDTIKNTASKEQQSMFLDLMEQGKNLNLKFNEEEQCFIDNTDDVSENSELHQTDLKTDLKTENTDENKQLMQRKLTELSYKLEELEIQANKDVDNLNKQITQNILTPLLKPIIEKFADNKNASEYFTYYQEDIVNHIDAILQQDADEFMPNLFEDIPLRYQINIMVTNEANSGSPVVFEDMPTHYNLIGHVEQMTHMGSISTDFSLIRAGSLHRANGGFLVLEALTMLEQPYAWQGIKRALQSKQIKLSSLEQMITLTGSISLEPDSIPLQVKVILLGEPFLYYELLEFEPEFDAIFKVRADFSDTMHRTPENENTYVQMIADYVKEHDLLDFDRSALSALIEYACKQAEEQNELSLHANTLGQMLSEANSLAQTEYMRDDLAKSDNCAKADSKKVNKQRNTFDFTNPNRNSTNLVMEYLTEDSQSSTHQGSTKKKQITAPSRLVTATHIAETLENRYYRMGYLRELYWHDLARGFQLISTTGKSIGQINALTVIQYADSEFGLPARLTATVHQGSGDIIDVERDVNLAGNLHAKGMMIMSSYMRALFGQKHVLSFTATLTFEQNYGEIDGDSATLAEACALISALSGFGIEQSWAITGSMNQFGDVQPIGGINAKIEGFYDTCKLKNLTGEQGVIIPVQNQSQLMLRQDIIESVEKGEFHIYAVSHLSEALEKLLDTPCGTLDKKGKYTKDSVYAKVMQRLKVWRNDDEEPEEKPKKKKKKKKTK